MEAGKLVRQRPATSVHVCYVQGPKNNCADVPHVVVMPHVKDFNDEHTHYRCELVCRHAGVNTIVSEDGEDVHYVTDPDPTLSGWLPADHAVFSGRAPAGAVFGYNFAGDLSLSRVWPPLPLQSVGLLWDKGAELTGATEVPLGPAGAAICDVNGIWWMSRCFGDVPWPANYTDEPEDEEGTPAACPRAETMRLAIVFIRMLGGNDRRLVTSLAPQTDSPIQVLNCDDLPATTGDLKLGLELQTAVGEAFCGQAFKEIANYHQLKAGWLTEGIVVHSQPQISVTGTRTRLLTDVEKDFLVLPVEEEVTAYQGLVSLTLENEFVDRELLPQIIRLSDTVERLYNDIPYLGFPPGQASLLRLRFNVPEQYLGADISMKISVQLFGQGGPGQTLPSFYMTYRRIPRPTTTGTALPLGDSDLLFDSAATINPYTLIGRESAAFSVVAGDTVLVTIGRAAGDAYPGEVGILRVAGVLFKPTPA